MPRGSSAGLFEVRFDPAETRRLVQDLKGLADGRLLTTSLRRDLKRAAEPIKRKTQANASWSSRIPGAISIGTRFSKRNTGIFIRVNGKRAPHARPYENGGAPGSFRHPVWGNRAAWVSQPARPFFFKTAAGSMGDVERAAADSVDRAARSAGFR